MNRILIFLAATLVFLVLGGGGLASAHTTGASFEKTEGEYVVDVGYDPAQVRGGGRLILDFNIHKNGDPVAFDYVWVRLTAEDETLLATGIARAEIGPTTLLYSVPADIDQLAISVRFDEDQDSLIASEFILPVEDVRSSLWPYCGAFLGVVVLALGLIWFVVRRKGN